MGVVFSRWRSKASTLDQLIDLDKEIKSLELKKRTNLDSQKKVIGSLVLYSVIGYIIAVVVFYCLYLPDAWSDRAIYSSPLLAFPLLVWLIKRLLHWYFVRQISKNDSLLDAAKSKRKTILEEVMEKETYKKAKEILEKFDPDSLKSIEQKNQPEDPKNPDLRQRRVDTTPIATPRPPNQKLPPHMTPKPTPNMTPLQPPNRGMPGPTPQRMGQFGPPGPPLPRTILPRERSLVDRLVEGLVGDGPQNRYALVCKECFSHNGMALKEEFEYITFRCCYCYRMNPARKVKANPPRLDLTPALKRRPLPNQGFSFMQHQQRMGFNRHAMQHPNFHFTARMKSKREPRHSYFCPYQNGEVAVNGNTTPPTSSRQNHREVEEIQTNSRPIIAEESSDDDNFVEFKASDEKKVD